MEFELVRDTEGRHDILSLYGDVDISCHTQLRSAIENLVLHGRVNLVVDLTATSFLDSTALGSLIAARRKAHAFKGSFAIVCDQPRLLRMFQLTRLERVFAIYPSREAWRRQVDSDSGIS